MSSSEPRIVDRRAAKLSFQSRTHISTWGVALLTVCALGLGGCVSDATGELEDEDAGGGDQSDSDGPPSYCTIKPILAAKCLRCHGDPLEHGAPVALTSYEAFHMEWGSKDRPLYERVGDVVERDFMPATWISDADPPVAPLTQKEKALIMEWVELAAPASSTKSDCAE
jgi:hypothetical protein